LSPRARTVLPIDLVALVSYDGKVYANEAMTRDRIGTQDSPHPLETAFEQWFSFATGRHTCVSVKGPTLRGLVSARKRATKQVWEIDCLINAAESDNGVLMSLLDQMTEAAGKSGAMRIFLRLPADGETAAASSRSGFAPYLREQVFARSMAAGDEKRDAPEQLRRRTKADQYAVFRLYNAVVPQEVRRLNGMTLGEWSAAQESLGRTTQYVVESGSKLTGWLRVAGDGDIGRFDLMGEPEELDGLIDAALSKVANRERAVTIVPEYQVELASRLIERGFEPQDEYSMLSRRTVRPVKVASPVPAIAQTTFG
jgi:hypothetical protein